MKLCNILVSTCCAWSWKKHFENLKSNLESFEEKPEQHPKGMKVAILSENKPRINQKFSKMLFYWPLSRFLDIHHFSLFSGPTRLLQKI
jgi:hypothetical protein